jgi:hypothetical protein
MYYGLNIMSYIYYQAIKLLDNNKYITNLFFSVSLLTTS